MGIESHEQLDVEYGKARTISLRAVGSVVFLGVGVFFAKHYLAPFEGLVTLTPIATRLLRIFFFALAVGGLCIWSLIMAPNMKRRMLSTHNNESLSNGSVIRYLVTVNFAAMIFGVFPSSCGTLLYFLFGQMIDFYLLAGLSLVFIALHFPRYTVWELLLRQGNLLQM